MQKWGIVLWDRFDDVSKHILKGIDFCGKYQKFLESRAEAEFEYAKSLKKICNQFDLDTNDKSTISPADRPTYLRCYSTMLEEIRDVASQHELIAENIKGNLVEKMNSEVRILRDGRKQCISDKEKYQAEFLSCEKELYKARENYENASKSLENAKAEFKRLHDDLYAQRINVIKAETKVETKQRNLDTRHAEYAAQLGKTNTMKALFYQNQLPQCLDVIFEDSFFPWPKSTIF